MGKGLRFNAKKEQDGKYFSTIIYKFTMSCYSCDQKFVIKTDPRSDSKDNGYICVEGLRKMEQDYVPAHNDPAICLQTDEHKYDMEHDAIYRMSHLKEDEKRAIVLKKSLEDLETLKSHQAKDDYELNSKLRRLNRKKKSEIKDSKREGRKRGLDIAILPEDISDADKAANVIFNTKNRKFRGNEKADKMKIINESIFADSSSKPTNFQSLAKSKPKSLGNVSSLSSNGNERKSGKNIDEVLENMKMQNSMYNIDPKTFTIKPQEASSKGVLKINLNVSVTTRPVGAKGLSDTKGSKDDMNPKTDVVITAPSALMMLSSYGDESD